MAKGHVKCSKDVPLFISCAVGAEEGKKKMLEAKQAQIIAVKTSEKVTYIIQLQ